MDITSLPPEVLRLILDFIQHTPTLSNLLHTSHFIRSITEPALYHQITLTQSYGFAYRDILSRINSLKRTIRANPHLAGYIHSLLIPNIFAINDIVPLLVNLHCLSFDEAALGPAYGNLSSIKSLSLTHLAWKTPIYCVDMPEFISFLESQTSLEYLDLLCYDTDFQPLMTMAPTALPRLHTLISSSNIPVQALLPGRSIRHLSFDVDVDHNESFDSPPEPAPYQFPFEHAPFHTIQSLSCLCDDSFLRHIDVAACCPNLRYLWLAARTETPMPVSMLEQLGLLKETQLVYLVIYRDMPPDPSDEFIPTIAFDHVPSLQIIDIQQEDGRRYRYNRSNEGLANIMIPYVKNHYHKWDLWFHGYELDLS